MTKTDGLTVLEASSPQMRCQQVHVLFETCRRTSPGFFPASGSFLGICGICGLWLPIADACFCCHVMIFQLSAFTWQPFYKVAGHTGLQGHPMPTWPHLNYLHQQSPYFQIRSLSVVLGVRTSTYIFIRRCGGHDSTDSTHNKKALNYMLRYFSFLSHTPYRFLFWFDYISLFERSNLRSAVLELKRNNVTYFTSLLFMPISQSSFFMLNLPASILPISNP